jgi:hypothetical protein
VSQSRMVDWWSPVGWRQRLAAERGIEGCGLEVPARWGMRCWWSLGVGSVGQGETLLGPLLAFSP